MDILIVDDHPVFASGLKELLNSTCPNLSIAVTSCCMDAIRLLEQVEPKPLLLLDLTLGSEDSLDQIPSLLALFPSLNLAILSAENNLQKMENCLVAGAIGYISKSFSHELILAAIRTLLEGGSFIPKPLLKAILLRPMNSANDTVNGHAHALTLRQKEVVACLCKGLSNKQIAKDLGISEGTIKLHVSNILSLHKVTSRSELIVKLSQTS